MPRELAVKEKGWSGSGREAANGGAGDGNEAAHWRIFGSTWDGIEGGREYGGLETTDKEANKPHYISDFMLFCCPFKYKIINI